MVYSPASANTPTKDQLKSDILTLAESFKGEGDPDRSKQKQLDTLVEQLLRIEPQEPIEERLPVLHGAWQQVWGPYDYRSDGRGVDPSIDPDHIYQVISPKGYYYNVNPDAKNERFRIGLLRGEYRLAKDKMDTLAVRFTKFNQLKSCPTNGMGFIDLPEASEAGTLADEHWLVPPLIVKLFFDKGWLREVYTDETLRIAYGAERDEPEDDYIYILKRVHTAPIPGCKN